MMPIAVAAVAMGVPLGVLYTLSPMTVWFLAVGGVLVWAGGRGLPERERRWVRGLLVAALAVRAALVAWLFVFGSADTAAFNIFFGDEQYMLTRSLRIRDFWLGLTLSPAGFIDLYDVYGRTSYLDVIAAVQMVVGPAPYGIHLLNAIFYGAGAVGLHRLCRAAYGRLAALGMLAGVLFYPSLIVWSASALKESLNFLIVVCIMWGAVVTIRRGWRQAVVGALVVVAGLLVMITYRAGAFEIAIGGLAVGLALRALTQRTWRLALAAVALLVIAWPVLANARVQDAALSQLRPAAHMHIGHVITRGHSYRVLDDRFYQTHKTDDMTWSEGLRYLGRAVVSVFTVPRPWDLQSRAELAYLPEQMLWYVLLVLAACGVVIGLRRDALVTALLTGYALIALLAVALTTGNIGTLVRHRAFALPYTIALGAVAAAALIEHVASRAHTMRTRWP